MYWIRFVLIAATLSCLIPGGAASANDECNLAVGYLLEYEDDIEFGVSVYRCTDHWRLEFEKFLGRLADGAPLWDVLDVLEVAKKKSDEVIVAETCSIGGVDNKGIVVVAQETEEDWFVRLRVAWRADRELGRWMPIDPATVRCWNEVAGFS